MKIGDLKIRPDRSWKEIAICFAAILVFSWIAVVSVHGCYRDFVADEMHGDECYWCNAYRFGNIDNAAFQTRELRRKGGNP